MFFIGIIDFINKDKIYKSFDDYIDEKIFKACIELCFHPININSYISNFIINIYNYLLMNKYNKKQILKKYIPNVYSKILNDRWNNIFYSFYSYTNFIRKLIYKKPEFHYIYSKLMLFENSFNKLSICIYEFFQHRYLNEIFISTKFNKNEFIIYCYNKLNDIINQSITLLSQVNKLHIIINNNNNNNKSNVSNDFNKFKESNESKESKESDESKKSEESKESDESKESEESEESKETKESDESKESEESKETNETKKSDDFLIFDTYIPSESEETEPETDPELDTETELETESEDNDSNDEDYIDNRDNKDIKNKDDLKILELKKEINNLKRKRKNNKMNKNKRMKLREYNYQKFNEYRLYNNGQIKYDNLEKERKINNYIKNRKLSLPERSKYNKYNTFENIKTIYIHCFNDKCEVKKIINEYNKNNHIIHTFIYEKTFNIDRIRYIKNSSDKYKIKKEYYVNDVFNNFNYCMILIQTNTLLTKDGIKNKKINVPMLYYIVKDILNVFKDREKLCYVNQDLIYVSKKKK